MYNIVSVVRVPMESGIGPLIEFSVKILKELDFKIFAFKDSNILLQCVQTLKISDFRRYWSCQ